MTSRGDALGRGTRAALALAGFLTLAASVAACDRTYLTPSHGRAYRETFAVQTVNPKRQTSTDGKSVQGLDSQEASIIAGTYRKQLAPGSNDSATQGQVLTFSRTGTPAAPMAPSAAGPSEH